MAILSFVALGTAHAQSVSITSYGAVADGVTDNLPAINRAIAAAQAQGVPVSIPAGTFAYRGVIRITSVKLIGAGSSSSILHALDYNNASIFMYGNGSEVRNLQLNGVKSPSRLAPWEATRITLFGATNFVIDSVYIEGSGAAGIQTAQRASNGRITNNIVRNTLSDSIHMTDGAGFITVENNFIENSGDDGIAVVSYQGDGTSVHDITARNNRVLNNRHGRNMSVAGGRNVLYENNYLEGNPNWACLYISQEIPYHTFGVFNATAQYNTIKNCGSTTTGHSAVMIYTDNEDYLDGVKMVRNDIYQPSTHTAFRVFGNLVRNILLDSNRINGTTHDYAISSSGVTLIRYTSGAVGYVAPGSTPTPTPTPAPSYTLSISSPASGATVSGTVQVVGSGPGFLNVEIFNSAGTMLAQGTPSSTGAFSLPVNTTQLSNGIQALTIYAWDSSAGQAFTHSAQTSLSVNVQNLAPTPTPTPSDTVDPVVSITSPTNNAVFTRGSTVSVSATATDNVGVTQVQFYSNGALICTDLAAPYQCSIRLQKKRRTYTIEAVAWDAAGRDGRHSIVITGQ